MDPVPLVSAVQPPSQHRLRSTPLSVAPGALLEVLELALGTPTGPPLGAADVAELGAAPAADVAAGGLVLNHGEAAGAPPPPLLARHALHELHVAVLGALRRVCVRGGHAVHARDVFRLAPRPAVGRVDPVRRHEEAAVWRGAVVPLVDGHTILLLFLLVHGSEAPGGVLQADVVVDGACTALWWPVVF